MNSGSDKPEMSHSYVSCSYFSSHKEVPRGAGLETYLFSHNTTDHVVAAENSRLNGPRRLRHAYYVLVLHFTFAHDSIAAARYRNAQWPDPACLGELEYAQDGSRSRVTNKHKNHHSTSRTPPFVPPLKMQSTSPTERMPLYVKSLRHSPRQSICGRQVALVRSVVAKRPNPKPKTVAVRAHHLSSLDSDRYISHARFIVRCWTKQTAPGNHGARLGRARKDNGLQDDRKRNKLTHFRETFYWPVRSPEQASRIRSIPIPHHDQSKPVLSLDRRHRPN
jgi:hypothetical protein